MLRYNNDGRVIPHVEPRDLSDDDIQALITEKRLFSDENEAIEALTQHGVYSLVKASKRNTKTETVDTIEDES